MLSCDRLEQLRRHVEASQDGSRPQCEIDPDWGRLRPCIDPVGPPVEPLSPSVGDAVVDGFDDTFEVTFHQSGHSFDWLRAGPDRPAVSAFQGRPGPGTPLRFPGYQALFLQGPVPCRPRGDWIPAITVELRLNCLATAEVASRNQRTTNILNREVTSMVRRWA